MSTMTETAVNTRRRTLNATVLGLLAVLAIVVAAWLVEDRAAATSLSDKLAAPSLAHPFGTDWLGRDMFSRVLVGLRLSLGVGLLAAAGSAVIALVLAALATTAGSWAESAVTWLVDLFLAVPHLVLLILVTFALGGGTEAVVIAVAVTHWPSLTRVLMAQGRVVAHSDYVALSRGFGRGSWHVARRHVVPHLMPHVVVGGVLLFPHAIMHEAALSFLGLGIDPSQPAVGVLMRDSMRFLSTGQWWLALLPGLCLLALVLLIDSIGDNLRALTDPRSHHR
jgi:peptide/nickel transport system permease protein